VCSTYHLKHLGYTHSTLTKQHVGHYKDTITKLKTKKKLYPTISPKYVYYVD